jgi:hypothetical protein
MSGTGHSEPASDSGAIRRQPIADFSHLSSPEEMAAITRIERVAMVIVPKQLAAAYEKIPRTRVGATIYVPGGANVRVHTGSLMLSGDGLGAAEDVLVVVGLLIITSPVTGPVPQQISVAGSMLAPRGSEQFLGPVLSGGAGSVTYYRYAEGQDLKVLTGQVKLSGAMLANPAGQPGDVLVAAGQVVVTGQVSDVGYAQVVVGGQLVAPAASRDLLEPRVHVQGQALWYRSADHEPKIIFDDTRVGPDYFRLLDHPVSLVVLGDMAIEPGVTEAMVREKVSEIIVLGDLTAPAALVPLLQVLATDVLGTIQADDGQGS